MLPFSCIFSSAKIPSRSDQFPSHTHFLTPLQSTTAITASTAADIISIRQHTPAYVSIRQHTSASAYVSISTRQHTSAYVRIRQNTSGYVSIRQHTSAYVSIRQHTSAAAIIYVLSFATFFVEAGVVPRDCRRRPLADVLGPKHVLGDLADLPGLALLVQKYKD